MKNSKIYPWIVVGLLWGVALLNYMDRQMLSTMKEAMQIDIVELQSAANFGYLMAVFLWILQNHGGGKYSFCMVIGYLSDGYSQYV